MYNSKLIEDRIQKTQYIKKYLSKQLQHIKNIDNESICLRKKKGKKGEKIIINVGNKIIYYGIEKRLGTDETETKNESYYGEVYKLYYPHNKKINRDYLAGKIIPLTDFDFNNKHDYLLSNSWKELFIMKKLSSNILEKKLCPNFSFYYGYFICSDGNLDDYDNKNILRRMQLRNFLEDINEQYNSLKIVVDDYLFATKRINTLVNKINFKVKTLGEEIKKHKFSIEYPNSKYNLITLIELENSDLYHTLETTHLFVKKVYNYNKRSGYNDPLFEDYINKYNLYQPQSIINGYTNLIFIFSLIFQVIFAIDAMNNVGIIHLDLHIRNILISYNDQLNNENNVEYWSYKVNNQEYLIPNYGIMCKIADFGLSEPLERFEKRKAISKRKLAEDVIDKLSHFVFSPKEEKEINDAAGNIINNFVKGDPKILFYYMKYFDITIFLISLIHELKYIIKKIYYQFINEQKKQGKLENLHATIEALSMILNPEYIRELEFILNKSYMKFMSTVGKKNMPKPTKDEFKTTLQDILVWFKKSSISLEASDKIINKQSYVVK